METDEGTQPELADIRLRLDVVDGKLLDVLLERTRLINEVIQFKRAHAMAVVDRTREDEMLSKIEAVADSKGLDPRIARQVLRAIIDSFTLLEVEQLGESAS